MSDPFGHRKYHGLYFILGFLIAFVVFMMLSGCEKGTTDKGKDCMGFAGMSIEGEQCEPDPIMCCMAMTWNINWLNNNLAGILKLLPAT